MIKFNISFSLVPYGAREFFKIYRTWVIIRKLTLF